MANRYELSDKRQRVDGLTLEEFLKEPISCSNIEFVWGYFMHSGSEWHYIFGCKKGDFILHCDDPDKNNTPDGLRLIDAVENLVRIAILDKPDFYSSGDFRQRLISVIENIHKKYNTEPQKNLRVSVDYLLP